MFLVVIKLSLFIQEVSSFLYVAGNDFEGKKEMGEAVSSGEVPIDMVGSRDNNGDKEGVELEREGNVVATSNVRSERRVIRSLKDEVSLSPENGESKSPESEAEKLTSQYWKVCSTINKERVNEKRYWTHLVFIHADNNLESMSLVDLGEMTSPLQTQTADHLHLVVYIDRCRDFTNRDVSVPIISCPESGLTNPKIRQESISQHFTGAYILYRWRLTRELRALFRKRFVWIILEDLGEVDSNSPEILSSFISRSLDAFPSIYSALTLWNHGSAWSGFGDDHDNADGNGMSLSEMYRGIKEGIVGSRVGGRSGESFYFEFKFDILGFDACLMMQFDVLEVMSSLASYILASEDNEPGHGWNFRSLNPVTRRGSAEDEVQMFGSDKIQEYRIATPLEYASRIVYGYTLHSQSYPLTLSLISTDLYRVFRFNLYNLFTVLYKCGGEGIGDILKKTVLNSKRIENCDMSNLCSCYDMGDMLELLRSYLSQEFSLDKSIQELLALTLDSYYEMQVASVNIQECRDPESEFYGNCEGDMHNSRDMIRSRSRSALAEREGGSFFLESRLTGVSIYYPDPDQQVLCRNELAARTLAKKYVKQTSNRWVQIISDILTNKPGQMCNLELTHHSKAGPEEEEEFDVKVNRTQLSVSPGEGSSEGEIVLTSRLDYQVVSSQTLISYPVNQGVGNLVPVSLIFPTRIKSKGMIVTNYRHVGYEIHQERREGDSIVERRLSNLTLVTDLEREHFTGHFMYYEKEEMEREAVEKASIAYLVFNKTLGSPKLLVSSPEGMSEKPREEGGFLVPILYYLKVDSRRNQYFDQMYRSICSLYARFSEYLNGLSYPLIGMDILPRYDELSIKSRRVQLVAMVQRDKSFRWRDEVGLRERSYVLAGGLEEKRVLISRYSITSDGYDELSTLGIGNIFQGESFGRDLSLEWPGRECNENWLEDKICDIFCTNDNKDCEQVLVDRGAEKRDPARNQENVGYKKALPHFLESPSIHVECDLLDGKVCWRNSKCLKSRVSNMGGSSSSYALGNMASPQHEDEDLESSRRRHQMELNNMVRNYCICDEGFQHQVVKVIDSKTGSIFFRHNCEDINECEEHDRQLKVEEKEQKQGDIYMGYNTNHAVYPSIERTREVTGILNSPFSSVKKHVVTPSGLKKPCHPLAVCINKQGGYDCICKPGYYGDGKKTCIQENVCPGELSRDDIASRGSLPGLRDGDSLMREASCPKGLQCMATQEFDGVGLSDSESQMLSLFSDDLQDSSGQHYCGCKKGYRISFLGDLRCVDVDECEERESGKLLSGCGEDSLCTNTVGSYICSCPVGWDGNGIVCIPKGERRDIALKVELSGVFERIMPMGYENFVDSFKQSMVQVLGIDEGGVEVVDIGLDNALGVIRVVVHFKSGMSGRRLLAGKGGVLEEDEHFNLKKAEEFVGKLRNSTSDWYKRTYLGMSFGDMVNPGRIEMTRVERRGLGGSETKVSRVVSGLLPDRVYVFIHSSPFGKTMLTLTLITFLVWLGLCFLGLVLALRRVQGGGRGRTGRPERTKREEVEMKDLDASPAGSSSGAERRERRELREEEAFAGSREEKRSRSYNH